MPDAIKQIESMNGELDPNKTVLVCKTPDGKEVGRIAAHAPNAPNANDYMVGLTLAYDGLQVDYEIDETGIYAILARE